MDITQNARTADFVLSLANGTLSLENAILATGNELQAGAVVGEVFAAAGSKISGNGDGVIGAVTLGAAVERGTYVLTCTAAASNAGTFSVITPSGNTLPNLTVGTAYSGAHINLTVADGGTDWGVGAVIHVDVTPGSYAALNTAASDGSQIAAGLLYARTDASDGAVACVVVARSAEIKADGALWPNGITDGQKAAAIASLNARGIFLR